MDAQRILHAAIAVWLLSTATACGQQMYQTETTNFVVVAPDPRLATETGRLAEQYRQQLSLQWLGRELPTWHQRCPIQVEISPHAGGETTFSFSGPPGTSEPSGWRMRIFGSPERILDAVLPHEITHTIFATHFGQPLPRWADEGACTTVEHFSEREKIHKLLLEFLRETPNKPSRGIPFNRMFTMKQYPDEMLPLYAQSYSVARYLIMQRGHQHFVNFVQNGLELEQSQNPLRAWDASINRFYGYEDLSDFQLTWQDWVSNGSRDLAPTTSIAATLPETTTNSPVASASFASTDPNPVSQASYASPEFAAGRQGLSPIENLPADSWYRQQLTQPSTAQPSDQQNTNQSLHRIDSTIHSTPGKATPPSGTIWR